MSVAFFSFFASIVCHFSSALGQQTSNDCPTNVFGRKDTFYVVSDHQQNAYDAQSTCRGSRGSLAQVEVGTLQQELIKYFEQRILPQDLDTVNIFQSLRIDEAFKYRALMTRSNDTERLTGNYVAPPRGNLSSIKLFTRATEGFSSPVVFCHFDLGDSIGNCSSRPANLGIEKNFILYGGNNNTRNGTIRLFNVRQQSASGSGFSTFLVFSHQASAIQTDRIDEETPVIYLPAIAVFIGARSLSNENDWYWDNGTMISSDDFRFPNASSCQQMSWPLTYNDGINLEPRFCFDTAHYLCQIKFTIEVRPVQCNGTSLLVTWSPSRFEPIARMQEENLFVKLQALNEAPQTFVFWNSVGTLSGLSKRTRYTIQASVESNECETISVSTSSFGTTAYGNPDQIMNAHVSKNSSNCTIEWFHDFSDTNIIRYTITASSQANEFQVTSEDLENETLRQSTLQQLIDLSSYSQNETFRFTIQAFSCGGGSELANVVGDCKGQATEEAIEKATTLPPVHSPMFIIVFAVVPAGVVLIVLLIIMLIVVKKRRKPHENGVANELLHDNDMEMEEAEEQTKTKSEEQKQNLYDDVPNSEPAGDAEDSSNPRYQNVHVSSNCSTAVKLKSFYLSEIRNSFENIKKEFKKMNLKSISSEPEHEIASDPKNAPKNRYRNIYPYDHAVVPLSNNNYMNASYIEGYRDSRRYIATQGPKLNTLNDFWEMVWLEQSAMIVMLCNCIENKKSKCEVYWPQETITTQYGNISVEGKSEENLGGILKRTFSVRQMDTNEERQIIQLHFISWPDHDIPLTTSGMFRLRKLVNHQHSISQSNAPIIIHCSAGSGRTGTYVAIDNLVENYNETGEVDIVETVLAMRRNRKDMIQNSNQYIFVYKLLLEHLLLKETEMSVKTLPKVVASTEDWYDYVDQEYQQLFVLSPDQSPDSEESPYENYSPYILSSDVNRVFLKTATKKVPMDAHIIENDRYPSWFVASSRPQRRQEEEFVEMILQYRSKIVVCLEILESDFFLLDRRQVDDVIEAGKYAITINHVTDCNEYVILTSSVSDTTADKNLTPLTLIFLRSWSDLFSPPTADSLAGVVAEIKSMMAAHQPSTAVVYCRDGCTRTGVFLVFANLLEQLKCKCLNNQTVDVFRTVKDLKEMRAGMVDTLEQYRLCYTIINQYLLSNPL